MLRKLIVVTIVANFVFMAMTVITSTLDTSKMSNAIAQTVISAQAQATVPNFLRLENLGIRRIPHNAPAPVNPWLYPNATLLDFGTLVEVNGTGGNLGGEYYYTSLMIPVTSGRAYTITSSGTALSLPGTNATIDQAFFVVPDFQWQDELMPGVPQHTTGPTPVTVGSPKRVATGGTLFTSTSTGLSRILRGTIAISGPEAGETQVVSYSQGHNGASNQGTRQPYTEWSPVTREQRGGAYAGGSVTFTLSLTP